MTERRARTWLEGSRPTPEEREEHARFLRIDAAFRAGDLGALREVVGDAEGWIEAVLPPAIGPSLEYAIYHSPLGFIAALLASGANPTPEDHAGFPPLIAALSCVDEHPGAKARPDVIDILALLLQHGADPNQRGLNDYTALHMAVAVRSAGAVEVLLRHGADPRLRTRIDDMATPREMAEIAGLGEIARLLA
ncbi:MAG TPA: ankyrin repeat domain-containing protein, partial [Vicinamibacteria bacterium]